MFSSWKDLACKSTMSESSSLMFDCTKTLAVNRHAVVPKNFRIAATARSISPENYTPYSDLKLDIPR